MGSDRPEEDRFYQQIGSDIRRVRNEQGVSQSQLARQLGMSRASIGNIEAGRQRIQLHTLAWIAHHLAQSIHELLPAKIDTKRPRGTLPHEELIFTDESARDFVESTLRSARGE